MRSHSSLWVLWSYYNVFELTVFSPLQRSKPESQFLCLFSVTQPTNLGIRNGKDFLDHGIAEVGRWPLHVCSSAPYSKEGQEQLNQGLEFVSFPCNRKINSPILWASPPWRTFVGAWLLTHFSGKYSCQWVTADLSFEPTTRRRHGRHRTTSWAPLFLCRRSAGVVFYLSFLAEAFQGGNASYLLTGRSVYLQISFPPLACQYPSLLIFWAGHTAHQFAQALAWGCGGEHV